MLPTSQLLERNIALFNSGSWLVVNPQEPSWLQLCSAAQLTVLHQYFDVFQSCTDYDSVLEFDSRDIVSNLTKLKFEFKRDTHLHIFAPFVLEGTFDNALILMPKSKSHLMCLVEMASARLNDESIIYIAGENRSGIKSIAKQLAKFGDVSKVDSARHCTMLSYIPKQAGKGDFSPDKVLNSLTYSLGNDQWQCASFPGVFSENSLDDGTALLLESVPFPFFGKTLDFACGSGVIASYLMSKMRHLDMHLSDVSAIALYCAAHTLHQNQQQAKLIAANGLKGVKFEYQNIVTNPPFHTGIATDYQIVTDFISTAVDSIKKDGKLMLVANRFLPYPEQLKQAFKSVDVISQNTRFSVYSCSA